MLIILMLMMMVAADECLLQTRFFVSATKINFKM